MHVTFFVKVVAAFALLCFAVEALAQSQHQVKPRQVARLMTIGVDGSDPRIICETNGIQRRTGRRMANGSSAMAATRRGASPPTVAPNLREFPPGT